MCKGDGWVGKFAADKEVDCPAATVERQGQSVPSEPGTRLELGCVYAGKYVFA
jgi:hypothetical protein